MLAIVDFGITLLIGAGLTALAAALQSKQNKSLVQDDKPSPLATRGSFMPYVKGWRRVGPIVGWVGDRAITEEEAGKKGSALTPEVKIFRESAWHILAIGPGQELLEVEQSGNIIFTGPITPTTHPSGSVIDLGNEGSFAIYWGEIDQPINTVLGDANRVGISSRWPQTMYVHWMSKRLGQQPVWPLLTYTIGVANQETHLSQTPAVMAPNFTLDGPAFAIDTVVNGVEGVAKWQILGDHTADFDAGGRIRITGDSSLPDQDFDIYDVGISLVGSMPTVIKTDIFVVGGITGATGDGTLQAYSDDGSDAINPAHILAELFFSAWPYGIKQDKSRFDLDSLEELGTLMVAEGTRGSIIAKDGQDLRAVIAALMQDLGVMLAIDTSTGKIKFVPIREPSGTLPHLSDDVLIDLPEIETQLGERKTDRMVFTFTDRELRYRENTIGFDDAGQISQLEYFRAKTVQVTSTTDFNSANGIVERRSQEELAGGAVIPLTANRGARRLLPGASITASGIEDVLRVTSVERDSLSGEVKLQCTTDFYGVPLSTFVQNPGLVTPPARAVEQDLQFKPIEVPEFILPSGPQTVLVLRVRAHNEVDDAIVHISRDDSTYTGKGRDVTLMQGGVLADGIDVDELWELDSGPTFTALGPDISGVLDLNADLTSWRNGRQLCVIGDEIFFLRSIDFVTGNTYRLRGLLRARYDSRVAAHAAGAGVYILQDDDGLFVNDALLEPSVTLYAKTQPTGRGVVSLATVPSQSVDLYGKTVRPMPVEEIRFDTLSDPAGVSTRSWMSTAGTDDLPITWGYFTPRSAGTGAGRSGAGTPQSPADPEGDFLVEVLDAADVVQRSLTVSSNSFTYTEADRTSDFGGEPNSFKVRVTQLRAGLSADPVVQTFTRIT